MSQFWFSRRHHPRKYVPESQQPNFEGRNLGLSDEFSMRKDMASLWRRRRALSRVLDSEDTKNSSTEDDFRSLLSKRSPWTSKPGSSGPADLEWLDLSQSVVRCPAIPSSRHRRHSCTYGTQGESEYNQLHALRKYILNIKRKFPDIQTATTRNQKHEEDQIQESSEGVTQKKESENTFTFVPLCHIADQEQASHPHFMDAAVTDDFKTFLDVFSLIMTKEVKYLLMFLFDVPVAEAVKSIDDTREFLTFLTTRGVISTTSIAPLTVRIEFLKDRHDLPGYLRMRQRHLGDFVNAANSLFKLFKSGKFCASSIYMGDVKFERFLDSLSFLMTTGVIANVRTFFNMSPAQTDGKVNYDNHVFVNLMRREGIISPVYVDPLVFALSMSDLTAVQRIVEELFRLFQEGKIGAPINLTKVADGDFARFLNTLSLLMTTDVMKDLRALFVVPDITYVRATNIGNVLFCNLLKERGIISPLYFGPLFLALHQSGHLNIAAEAEKLFHLYEERGFGSSLVDQKEKEGEFEKFLDKLRLVITERVENGVAKIFHVPVTATNYDFFTCMKEKGVISMVTIAPLCDALKEVDSLRTANSATELFNLFKEGKFKTSYSLEKDNDDFKRFLWTLSLLISEDVEEELVARFQISVTGEIGTSEDNEMVLCTRMKNRGIVSPHYIAPLTNALYGMNKRYVARRIEDLFKLFQEGALSSSLDVEGEEDNFKRFLYTLSLLFSDDVQERLAARFHMPVIEEKDGNKVNGMALCTLLKKRGVVSSRYIIPLDNALYEMNKSDVARTSTYLFKLFQEGKLGSSLDVEGHKDAFRRFLHTLSFLISDDLQKKLINRFHIPATEETEGHEGNGMTLCAVMAERGIVSPSNIKPLTNALREMTKSYVARGTENIFKLFQEGALSSSLDVEGNADNFNRFLYTLSLLISDDVQDRLVARFNIPVKEETDENKDNRMTLSDISVKEERDESHNRITLCVLMADRGIVSPCYVTPLTNALYEMNKTCVARSTEDLFKLFQEGVFGSSLDLERDEVDFKRFLDTLSLLISDDVNESLLARFHIPVQKKTGKDKDKRKGLLAHMTERGIVSPFYITPLTNALYEINRSYVASSTEDLFKLFQEGALSSSLDVEGEEDNFKRFLYTLSLLISDYVEERLVSRFHIPVMEKKGGEKDDGMTLCTLLKERGIVSSRYVTPLTIALKEISKDYVARSTEDLFKLFQEGTLSSPLDVEGDKGNFKRFLYTLSLLISDDVQESLVARFNIPVEKDADTNKDNGMTLCVRMTERGIVSPFYIIPLTNALYEMDKSYVVRSAEDLFKLFQEGAISSSLNVEGDEDNFKRFLYTLSLLISGDVKERLVARFHIPVAEVVDGNKDTEVALCTDLRERGIISPCYITPLTNALYEMNKTNVARSTKDLFKLFQEGALSSSLHVERDQDQEVFRRFLLELSLQLTKEVKEKLAKRLEIPFSGTSQHPDSREEDGFCKCMKQKGVTTSLCIIPLTLALKEMGEYRLADRAEKNFKQFQKTARAETKLKHDNTQGNTQSIDNVRNTDEVQESETEEGPSPEDIDSIQITSSKHDVHPMMRHTEENTGGNTQSIDENAVNNANVQDSETVEGPSLKDVKSVQSTSSEYCVESMVHHAEEKTKAALVPNDHIDEVHNTQKLKDDRDNVDEKQSHFHGNGGCLLSSLQATASVSNLGVSLVIGDTGVELYIPPNAFHERDKEGQIQMRIIPGGIPDETLRCFEDNATTVVELVPNMLQLRRNATLFLPHCLVLRDPKDCKVQILQSHHREGQRPLWEDISKSAQPKLHEKHCEFQLREFCWLKYIIRGQSVMGKRLLLYTLGENYTTEHVTATVGYIPALSGAQEVIKDEINDVTKGTVYKSNLQGRIIGCWQSFIFRKEPAKPLKISIGEIVPSDGWHSGEKSKQEKTISYSDVELSNEQSRSFTFNRIKPEAPFPVCRFEISQVEDTEIHIDLAQRSFVKPTEQPMVQTENKQSCHQEKRVSDVLRPINEARQVQNTEMVLSPNGEIAIRGQRHEEIILYPNMSSNSAQDPGSRLQGCEPLQRNAMQLQLPGLHENLPIFCQLSPSDISKLSSCLDPDHILHKDWRMLADKLGFTSGHVWSFQRTRSPTEAVICCACQSGKLSSKSQLMQILQDMERLDAKLAISGKPMEDLSRNTTIDE